MSETTAPMGLAERIRRIAHTEADGRLSDIADEVAALEIQESELRAYAADLEDRIERVEEALGEAMTACAMRSDAPAIRTNRSAGLTAVAGASRDA